MERYKIEDTFGRGAQGVVYLTENKLEQKQYILKQVECKDESECNKAFKESLPLLELKHPYLCQYKEFFVSWDKELSAMNLNVVSEYFERGSLANLLAEKRANKEAVDEELIMKWIGQILEAFIYIHKRKHVHRDLKPNNLYLSKEDNSLAIGDFGVPAVMADIRTKTRCTVGSMNWMAPEVLNQAYDAKTDMWSIGCILLELASCQMFETGEIMGKLFEIKHSEEALEEILTEVNKVYSDDLIEVLRKMLSTDREHRPEPIEAIEGNHYLKQCMAISNSIIVERKKRSLMARDPDRMVQRSHIGSELEALASSFVDVVLLNACTAELSVDEVEHMIDSVPTSEGIPAVIKYIHSNMNNEICMKKGLEALVEMTSDNQTDINFNGKNLIAKALKEYLQEADVQINGFRLLNQIMPLANSNDVIYQPHMLSLIPEAMRYHNENPKVLEAAAKLLHALSAQEAVAEQLGGFGAPREVVKAMKRYPDEVTLLEACCNALWALTIIEDSIRIVTEVSGVKYVIKALQQHKEIPELAAAASAAIVSLAMEDVNLDLMNKEGVVSTLLEIMDMHQRDAKVMKNACMALTSMVEPDEECAYKVMTNVREDGNDEPGLPYIINVYHLHKDNAEVVENITTLLMELCEYDEICAEIKHLNLADSILHEVHRRFKENQNIMIPCEQALVLLGAKIRLHQPSAKKA